MRVPYCKQPETKRIGTLLYHNVRLCATAGGISIGNDSLVRVRYILCARCGSGFYVCQSCWRGQRFCSKECRQAARREAGQAAQRRYRSTEKGKEAHRWAEKRRRCGLTKKNTRIVDYKSSTPQCGCTTLEPSPGGSDEGRQEWGENASVKVGRCHFCGAWGIIVDCFPRRGYGKQTYTVARTSSARETEGRDCRWRKK